MEYSEVDIRLNKLEPYTEILIAKLDEINFESYSEAENGIKAYVQTQKLDLDALFKEDPIDPYKIAKDLRGVFQEDKPGEKMYYGLNKQTKLDLQELLYKVVGKDASGQIPSKFDKENENNKEKQYLADNENIEFQGTSAGGTVELSSKRNIKNASKIADELYNRFNEEDRSLKDKQYIKNLLDWY